MKRRTVIISAPFLLAACATPKPAPIPKIGIALGGGGVKGFAHIGVLKVLDGQNIELAFVAGTSVGSIVGALYASGMTGFALQEASLALDAKELADIDIWSLKLKGQKLQDYINKSVKDKPLERLNKPFVVVATELDTGNRLVFAQGNTGQAVRASCSIPENFLPTLVNGKRYIDGIYVSPVPVDAVRDLGADIIIGVDISAKAEDIKTSDKSDDVKEQSEKIRGQKLGEIELTRAEVVIRPKVGKIGSIDFDQKHIAILEGEKAAQAALPAIREAIRKWKSARA